MTDYRCWPKIDLHRHLEGAVRLSTARELALAAGLDLPYEDEAAFAAAFTVCPNDAHTLKQFLTKFVWLRQLITGPEALERLCFEAAVDAAVDGVVYLELRFNYIHLARRGLSDAAVIEALESGARRAKAAQGITVGYICGIARDMPAQEADNAVDFVIANAHRGVCAIDLMNDEQYGPELFQSQYARAKAAGLHRTVHAGEAAGPESIAKAVTLLDAQRIGHGARIFRDDGRAARLVREGNVLVECCPTSNLQTGAVASLAEHPLPRLRQTGMAACLCTDDPGVSTINLSGEYAVAADRMGMARADLRTMLEEAVGHIFLDAEKPALKQKIADYFEEA
ncbi:adenosine deaminase [Ruminococcaceae bacterium OttesenSCG-928-D13]|nr:adenosine deaminase [Ruminococcaceae bacterium OttesenSCG-928-D13]